MTNKIQIKRLNDEQAAQMLRDAVEVYVAEGKALFPRDADMLAMYARDRQALLNVAALIADGRHEGALDYACHQDTACRDVIPPDVWVHIGGDILRNYEFI